MAPHAVPAARLRPPDRRDGRASARPALGGFTLIELLVVIGIIAVLLSILLPTLRSVRRQANQLQCASNMKQVATAMIMYVQDNKGRFPPSGAPVIPGVYPRGWWWANELVRFRYVNTPGVSMYPKPGWPVNQKRYNRANPFRCPEGIDEDFAQNGSETAFAGDYPTHMGNSGYCILNDSQCAQDGLGIPSWYMLNSRVANTAGAMKLPGGSQATPYVWFNSDTTAATLKEAGYQRHFGYVKKSAELIMLVEATHPNFYHQAQSKKYPGIYFVRLAGRHGKKDRTGANAWTNFAFFDGHVALFPTVRFNQGPSAKPEWPADKFTQETIFWVGHQRRK